MGEGDRDSGGRGPRQRHIKLIAEGDTFPLSVSEHNPSTQPAAAGGHNLQPRRGWPPSPEQGAQ